MTSQVDFRVGQLLAADPDSPLGVSEKGEYQDAEPHLQRTGGAYRKTAPVLLLGASLPVNGIVLFGVSFGPASSDRSKVPDPDPPGTSWDRLGWAK